MAFTVGDHEVRPLTADEVLRMVEAGILAEDERVELLHGVLTRMSPQGEPHMLVIERLNEWLAPGLVARRYRVRVQGPLSVPDPTSLPEPDIAVVDRDADLPSRPRTARLVIEVAVSSLRTDTRVKPALYASAGVPELWVVDVARSRVHVLTGPTADGYADERIAAAPERLQPRAVEVAPLDLEALFAGLA